MTEKFSNILLLKPSSIGDIVMALPALTALRRAFRHARISWLIRPEFAPLIKNHPHLDNLVIFDRKLLAKAYYNYRALESLVGLIKYLRNQNFDLIIDLQGLFRTAVLGWLSGCKNRIGMADAREMAPLFYTLKVPQNRNCIHLVDFFSEIVRKAGAEVSEPEFVLPVEQTDLDYVRDALRKEKVNTCNYAVIIPGSAHQDKIWPPEKFARLIDKLSNNYHLAFVASGLASESGIVEKIRQLSSADVHNFAGRTNLSQLKALLSMSRVVITNDTGPGHIAYALNRPMVMIFGRSNPLRLAPYKRSNCVVAAETETRGLAFNSKNPAYDIKKITVQQVLEKVSQQLNETIT